MKMPCIHDNEDAVSHLIEYIIITSVLLVLLVITMLTVNGVMIEGPVNNVLDHAFIDIGNGVSTRMVEVYIIAPNDGNISTDFDIPDEVAGRDYTVEINQSDYGKLVIWRGSLQRTMSLSGIGATKDVSGRTTSSGLNKITYNV
jgi:hypothetical protein